MDVPYLMYVSDGDELWLIDGEQRLLITPRIYDLLIKHGADLPPAYGIEELREQSTKLRELVRDMYEMAYPEFPSAFEAAFADRMRKLGIEVR